MYTLCRLQTPAVLGLSISSKAATHPPLQPQYALPSKRHSSLHWGRSSVPTISVAVHAAKTQEKVKSQERVAIKPAAKSNHVNAASVWEDDSFEPGTSSTSTDKTQTSKKQDLLVELYKLGKLALPLLLQYTIANSSHLINTSFVGHLSDPVLLSSMVLATSLSMATGYSIINGIASASETLCGQAYGAKNYVALNSTLQRALLICGLTCVPITAAWLNSEWILTQLGQTAAIAAGASRYLELTLPALYLYCIHECVDKYLLSQRTVKPALFITAATTALTPLFAWWFVVQQGLGLDGAAYAYCAVQACTTTLGLSYLFYREKVKLPADPPEGYMPLTPSLSALENWGPYVALAVPAVMSYCMEGWAVEVLIFLSGMLKNADVAVGVTGLSLQFSTFVWLAAASIGSATSTRVANKLGRGDAEGAKRTSQTAAATVLATQTLIGLSAYTFREPLLGLMTNNGDVIQLAMTVMPVLACCFIADGLNAVQGAVLRGSGRQWWAAGLNLAGWWGVGVPLAYYLAVVRDMNVPGLWAGFATASALQSVLQFVVINKAVDWDREVARAREMMAGQPVPESDDEAEDKSDDGDDDDRKGGGGKNGGGGGGGGIKPEGGPSSVSGIIMPSFAHGHAPSLMPSSSAAGGDLVAQGLANRLVRQRAAQQQPMDLGLDLQGSSQQQQQTGSSAHGQQSQNVSGAEDAMQSIRPAVSLHQQQQQQQQVEVAERRPPHQLPGPQQQPRLLSLLGAPRRAFLRLWHSRAQRKQHNL